VQPGERDKTPWRAKINLMANEFLPSRASGQLRRGAEEGSERDDGKAPEVSRKKVERYARKVHEAGVKRVVSCCTTFIPCVLTVKLRIDTKTVRHVKVAENHETGERKRAKR